MSTASKVVQLLLEHNPLVDIQDVTGATALHLANSMNNGKLIDSLLANLQNKTDNAVNDVRVSHFHIACTGSNAEIVEEFLKSKPN